MDDFGDALKGYTILLYRKSFGESRYVVDDVRVLSDRDPKPVGYSSMAISSRRFGGGKYHFCFHTVEHSQALQRPIVVDLKVVNAKVTQSLQGHTNVGSMDKYVFYIEKDLYRPPEPQAALQPPLPLSAPAPSPLAPPTARPAGASSSSSGSVAEVCELRLHEHIVALRNLPPMAADTVSIAKIRALLETLRLINFDVELQVIQAETEA